MNIGNDAVSREKIPSDIYRSTQYISHFSQLKKQKHEKMDTVVKTSWGKENMVSRRLFFV